MIVLDTDHASELVYRSLAGLRLLARLAESGEETVITAVTVEEGKPPSPPHTQGRAMHTP